MGVVVNMYLRSSSSKRMAKPPFPRHPEGHRAADKALGAKHPKAVVSLEGHDHPGEGSGKNNDEDRFDPHELHLLKDVVQLEGGA